LSWLRIYKRWHGLHLCDNQKFMPVSCSSNLLQNVQDQRTHRHRARSARAKRYRETSENHGTGADSSARLFGLRRLCPNTDKYLQTFAKDQETEFDPVKRRLTTIIGPVQQPLVLIEPGLGHAREVHVQQDGGVWVSVGCLVSEDVADAGARRNLDLAATLPDLTATKLNLLANIPNVVPVRTFRCSRHPRSSFLGRRRPHRKSTAARWRKDLRPWQGFWTDTGQRGNCRHPAGTWSARRCCFRASNARSRARGTSEIRSAYWRRQSWSHRPGRTAKCRYGSRLLSDKWRLFCRMLLDF